MTPVNIIPVETKRQLRRFIRLPWRIYKDDAHWVPPLIMDMKNILSKQKNPFFHHSDAQLFLAEQDGQIVGRIAAIVNNNHNKTHNETTGFFGFFECIEAQDVADALLKTAADWVRGKGMTCLRGPMNFSTNDTCGLLCEGFDSSPVIMMTYNPKYYLNLVQGAGLAKIKELYAYTFSRDMPIPERFVKFAEKVLDDQSITIRPINMKDFDNEVKIVREIYNDAWQHNWGFVPMTEAEIEHMAKDLKPVLDPEIVLVAHVNGEPAGFSLCLPDYNEILKHVNGRLFPFGLMKLLLNKRKIKGVRVIILGVRHKFQKKRGLAPAFYYETYRRGTNRGYALGEFSWILEDNVLMNRAIEGLGAKLYKKYAIYEREL